MRVAGATIIHVEFSIDTVEAVREEDTRVGNEVMTIRRKVKMAASNRKGKVR